MDEQREAIEAAFECPCFNFFAAAERGVFAAGCERHGGFHLFDTYDMSEIVDDDGSVLADGCAGRLLVSTLHKHAMRLIRYESGDGSGIQERSCSCGRPLRLPEKITTKREDLILLPSGEQIPPSAITHAFKQGECIQKSQVVQEDLHAVIVTVIPGESYTDSAAYVIRSALKQRLGADISVEVRTAPDLPPGPRRQVPRGDQQGGRLVP